MTDDYFAPISISGEIKAMTKKSILLVEDDETTGTWIPLSEIETNDDLEIGNYVDIEIPSWLAGDLGWA